MTSRAYERLWHALARTRALARRAAVVLASSRDTADRARERFGLDPARVRVVPAGPGDPGPPASAAAVEAVRRRHGLPDRYFLFVGALEPRKAVDRLVAALPAGEALAVVGDGRLAARLRGPGVHLVGDVDGAEKAALYTGALAVVLPSWCEGYGYPPLEGYAHGTPAIVSDLPALRETAGAGAVYVPAGDVEALAAALREVAADEGLRARLAAGGAAALRRARGRPPERLCTPRSRRRRARDLHRGRSPPRLRAGAAGAARVGRAAPRRAAAARGRRQRLA